MRGIWVAVLMSLATAGFAREGGIKCEAESHNEQDESLVIVCPPPFEFSPIRVKIVVGQIDNLGWKGVDLKKPAPVQVLGPGKSGKDVLILLPIQIGTHRLRAWRRFRRITGLVFYEDHGAGEDEGKGN